MNNVGCTHESSDERRGGPGINLGSPPHLFHPALMHHDDLVCELKSPLLLVGHQQACPAHTGPLQPCDPRKPGALARARRPEERADLSDPSLQADVPDRLKRAESLPQPLDDDALAHVPRPFSCLPLKISMPDNMKLDPMASVRATT